MLLVQVASREVFYSIIGEYIVKKVYCYPEVFFSRHVLALSEISSLNEVSVLFFISTITAQC